MHCNTCKSWINGYCTFVDSIQAENPNTLFTIEATAADDTDLETKLRTGPNFGCVHHKPTTGVERSNIMWDKDLTQQLIKEGLTREQAGLVVGVVAEHRQIADLQGYKRGYNDGYTAGVDKVQRKLDIIQKSSLTNNLCPDHRDKQQGKSCLACEVEQLQKPTYNTISRLLWEDFGRFFDVLHDIAAEETNRQIIPVEFRDWWERLYMVLLDTPELPPED